MILLILSRGHLASEDHNSSSLVKGTAVRLLISGHLGSVCILFIMRIFHLREKESFKLMRKH